MKNYWFEVYFGSRYFVKAELAGSLQDAFDQTRRMYPRASRIVAISEPHDLNAADRAALDMHARARREWERAI